MLEKIISFFMGQPTGYISKTDHFLAHVRKHYPQPSASQTKEIRQHQEIAKKRDGDDSCEPILSPTRLWRDF